MQRKTYLPIGSIVLLKNQRKRVMIYGRKVKDKSGTEYDYLGCLYPEGALMDGDIFLFNQSDISMIFFIGFQDIEELTFRKILNQEKEGNDH